TTTGRTPAAPPPPAGGKTPPMPPTLKNNVAGEWRPSQPTDTVEMWNPATGDVISRTPLSSAADVDHAVEAVADVAPGELSKAMLETATSTSVGRRLSREQALLLEALVAARREPTLQAPLSQVLTERLDVLERAVVQAQRAGELRPDLSPHALAWFLYLAPIGLLAGRAVELPGPELGELVEVLEAAMVGLRAQHPSGPNPTPNPSP
nr:hypothetical protein [Micromonospora sp. DSM 115978]